MNEDNFPTKIIPNAFPDVKETIPNGIRVTVHIPDQLHERVRQQKINAIYDLLKSNKAD